MSEHPSAPAVVASEPEPVSPGSGVRLRLEQLGRAELDVLVVDDDPCTGDGLARLVRSFGHGCRVASGGDEALVIMAQGRTNVVISDWDMPGMSGVELCKRIRSGDGDAPYTYFIFLTGFDDREHLFEAMEAGADHFERKPVDLDRLEAQLVSAARLIGRDRAARPHAPACSSQRGVACSVIVPL